MEEEEYGQHIWSRAKRQKCIGLPIRL